MKERLIVQQLNGPTRTSNIPYSAMTIGTIIS